MKNIEILVKIMQQLNGGQKVSHQDISALHGFGAMSFL